MVTRGNVPEVAPPGKVLPGREEGTRPLQPGAGMEVGTGEAEPGREPRSPAIGVGTPRREPPPRG